ncbi:sigma-70 family RNA polymerase sigma factor [uncultured Limosilactobacillus sp.]|uniref:sigma-70 family RNA polymerase sigma factor n=1 Tax=uncultured Limosilactobacillus sp. TaxID=2837629 RepID=UPI0025E315EA|nr:sigma-70 family RNA polymerase sigma factor [uncultured Limosilactobacillus sp.]
MQLNDYLKTTYQDTECQCIIFGVLKRLHIDHYHPDRPDYEQEARLIMARGMLSYDTQHRSEHHDDHPRYCYLYQHLYWRLIDQLRNQTRRRQQIEMSLDKEFADCDAQMQQEKILRDLTAEVKFINCEISQLMRSLLQQLTPQQRRYVQMLYLGYRPSEIATRLGISRQAVANLRKRVINMAHHYQLK